MRVLISGAGIAGPTLGYWLTRYGFETTIVERAPRLRTGGYIIDFWGAGMEVADRMGLLPEIRRNGYGVQEIRVVDEGGKKVSGFPASTFARVTRGGVTSLRRGDLAASIFDAVRDRVEWIFGDSVNSVEQTDREVKVTFERQSARSFDVVIGADGLHSRIRQLVFGADDRFERYLGFKVAAFDAEGYRPRDELVYIMYTTVGQQVARFAMRGDRTMFLFTFADEDAELPQDIEGQKQVLRKRFGRSGWECPQIVDALDSVNELYFDRVSQVHMNAGDGWWSRERIALTGDAAFCVSLLGGQGSSLAMVGAYILAGELRRADGNYREAFARYQQRLGPFLETKQRTARRFAGVFAPKSAMTLFLRNQIFRLLAIPGVANLTASGGFRDEIELPNY
jgi:2-polyprenyl-6-methoxyphenol hydroxylase-like FAD-dependent oxidoreductase